MKCENQKRAGKILTIYKISLLLLFLLFSSVEANDKLSSGDVVLIPLEEPEVDYDFYYNDNLVTKIINHDRLYLLFGIPYSSSEGINSFVLSSNDVKKIIKLDINKKTYARQDIKINKYREKTEQELVRIYREKQEITRAKKMLYNTYPDYNFTLPVDGIVTGVYGTERFYNGIKGNYHNGHDIAAEIGTPIYAPSKGKVMLIGNYFYNGKFVMINHGNNLISIFLHMDDIKVVKNSIVDKGQIIGTVGNTGLSTGPHLHWSVLLNNTYVDPLALVKKSKAKLDN